MKRVGTANGFSERAHNAASALRLSGAEVHFGAVRLNTYGLYTATVGTVICRRSVCSFAKTKGGTAEDFLRPLCGAGAFFICKLTSERKTQA